MSLSFARFPSTVVTRLVSSVVLLALSLGTAWAQATVDVGAPSNSLTTTQTTATFPVTITRSSTTPVLGFSVVFTLSGGLTLPSGTSSITTGTFLTLSGASATFQVRDLGGGQYAADGVTLGTPCGSSALTGTLFSVAVASASPGGTGAITINSVSLRDCSNQPLTSVAGSNGSVTIDNTLPTVSVSSPNGGEPWDAGSSHAITWSALDGEGFGPAAIDLEWSSDNGGSWSPVATGIGNSGSFSWTVPDVATHAALVRVTARDLNGNTATDASDAVFTVRGSSSTSLASSPDPSVVGESVTLTATVTPGTATGTVEFFEGATSLGTASVTAGTAAISSAAFALGAHTFHAVYSGDVSYLASTSANDPHTVDPAATSTSLSSSPNPSVVGQGTTLTVTVAAVAPGAGTPTGSVEVFEGLVSLGTATLSGGSASLSTSSLAAGAHVLHAVYAGTASFSGSTSSDYTHTVNPAATSTSLGTSPNPSTYGGAVLLSATVAAVAPGAGVPDGSVEFFDGVASLGTQPLVAGAASVSVSTLSAASHSLTAVYLGSASFTTSTSAIVTQVVNAAATAVSLVAAPDPGVYLDSETLTATVTPAAATGSVEFFDGASSLGTSPLASGTAVLATSALAVGPHTLTAQYLGDTNHAGATSAGVALEVKAKIVATAGANGSITPSGTVLVSLNATPAFAFAADPGYHVASVTVDGGAAALTSPYTFAAVSSNHTIDVQFAVNPPVPAITTLASSTIRTGNGSSGIERIRLTWSPVAPGSSVQVYRAPYGNYPEYDDGPSPGSVPAVPSYPPTSPWTLTSVTASGTDDVPPARDFYYYVAFVTDGFGTVSPVSNLTAGSLAYALGDISDLATAGQGDNQVFVADLSLLGSIYGRVLTPGDAFNYVDVGPTTDFSVHARPTTDNVINFEDLVMFGLNFDQVSAPAAAATPAPAKRDELRLDAPAEVVAGSTVTARLFMSGTGAVHAVSAALAWDPDVLEPAGHEMGAFLGAQRGVVLSPAPGTVDLAVLGSDVPGISGSGEVATVTFRARRAGASGLRLARVDARDGVNHRVTLATGIGSPATPVFRTGLALARPTPFRDRTELVFTLGTRGTVQVAVHAVDGRRIRTIASGVYEAGEHRMEWDGRDDGGRLAPAGVYYVRMVSPQAQYSRKLTFLR